jgi:hypothetical protein
MGNAFYYLVLIVAALIQVAFLTLIVLLLYKLFINKRVVSKQSASVFAWITVVNGTIGVIGYFETKEAQLTPGYFIFYLIATIGIGILVAHITRSDEVK